MSLNISAYTPIFTINNFKEQVMKKPMIKTTFWQQIVRWIEVFEFTTYSPYRNHYQAQEIDALNVRIKVLESDK
jgi:hypothetical protein